MKQINQPAGNQFRCSAIVAMAKNRVIGRDNTLPWRLPADLRRFKQITTGHIVLMGRKTYASIGKPLPNRVNIVLTRNPSFTAPGCFIARAPEEALEQAALHDKELFIIGGSTVYQQFLPYTRRIYLTLVDHVCEGDAYFPVLDEGAWREVSVEAQGVDAEHAYACRFLVWERELYLVRYFVSKKV